MDATDEALHRAEAETLERDIMRVARERTGAHHGAIMLWDEAQKALGLDFHVVDDVVVTMPGELLPLRAGGEPTGVASHVFLSDAAYVCHDAATDPYYRPMYYEVASIAAVPIRYQDRPIGVLSVSSRRPHVFDAGTLAILAEIAASAALFLRRAQMDREGRRLHGRPFLIKGLSPDWLEVERRIERVSPTEAPVLIIGESGTGKELTAHAIHFNSRRAQQAFVTVNCAAIPEQLLESLLFGHVRGAFSGATADKIGEFVKADKGTLFLDELGELPVPLQAKVLRAVEYGEVQPLGSNAAPQRVDVRLVAATNRDLVAMMRRREFRDDLYYRLSTMTMQLPPLRAYKHGNLQVMAEAFLKQSSQRHGKAIRRIGPDALAVLLAYDFPGNVRELKNAIEHAVIMAKDELVTASDLPVAIRESGGDATPAPPEPEAMTLAEMRERWLAPLERRYLAELLERSGGDVKEAARHAGINAVTMYRLLDRRGMSRRRRSR
ncbi:MAG: sigma 54-interacting transcriptional regulator [Sandaracinaceae bacterium]